MRCTRLLIAAVAIAATLVMGVRLGTEPVAAKGPPDPCKQPKPVCGRNSIALCAHRAICGCVKWTCAIRPPPMTKEPLKLPKPLPGGQLRGR
jgi:hypothetical protein